MNTANNLQRKSQKAYSFQNLEGMYPECMIIFTNEHQTILRFTAAQHQVKNNLSQILKALKQRSDKQINRLKIMFGEDQTSQNQIGQIIQSFKDQTKIQVLSVIIGKNNSIEQFFINSVVEVICSSETLMSLVLDIKKTRTGIIQCDLVAPLFQKMKTLQMQHIELNLCENILAGPCKSGLQISSKLRKMNIKLSMQEECSNIFSVNDKQKYLMQEIVLRFQFRLIKDMVYQSLAFDFLNKFKVLQILDLTIMIATSQNESQNQIVSLVQRAHSFNFAFLERLNEVKSLEKFKLSFNPLYIITEKQINAIKQFVDQNLKLKQLNIKIKITDFNNSTLSPLVNFKTQDLDLKVIILVTSSISNRCILKSIIEIIKQTHIQYFKPFYFKIIAQKFSAQIKAEHYQQVGIFIKYQRESSDKASLFQQLGELIDLNQHCSVFGRQITVDFNYFTTSGFHSYQSCLLFQKLFYLSLNKLNKLKIVFSNILECNNDHLLLVLNDSYYSYFDEICQQIENHKTINKIVFYHQDGSQEVIRRLMVMYETKIFLEFINHFPFLWKHEYASLKKIINQMKTQARRNRVYVQIIHKLRQRGLEDYKICNILDKLAG